LEDDERALSINSVVDPDPDWIQIQEGAKMTQENRKELIKSFIF
jgi:hypothetical protein